MAQTVADEAIELVRIPADVDQPDKIVAGLSARQAGVLGAVTGALWLGYQACRDLIEPMVYVVGAALVLLMTAVAVTMSHEGVSLDRLLAAWFRFTSTPKRQVLAPEGLPRAPKWLDKMRRSRAVAYASPVHEVTEAGVLDLGSEGVAVLAACTTVNLALRSPREQSALLAGFARWLNSLTGHVAILVRTRPADLSAVSDSILDQAACHESEALRAAAISHADFLAGLTSGDQLLAREVVLAVHERSKDAGTRLHRRLDDAASLLACVDVSAVGLSESEAVSLLSEAFNPSHSAALSAPFGG